MHPLNITDTRGFEVRPCSIDHEGHVAEQAKLSSNAVEIATMIINRDPALQTASFEDVLFDDIVSEIVRRNPNQTGTTVLKMLEMIPEKKRKSVNKP